MNNLPFHIWSGSDYFWQEANLQMCDSSDAANVLKDNNIINNNKIIIITWDGHLWTLSPTLKA